MPKLSAVPRLGTTGLLTSGAGVAVTVCVGVSVNDGVSVALKFGVLVSTGVLESIGENVLVAVKVEEGIPACGPTDANATGLARAKMHKAMRIYPRYLIIL
jgi:hypothetical protein